MAERKMMVHAPTGMTRRMCPACGDAQDVVTGEKLWPQDSACPGCGHVTAAADGFLHFAPALADTISGFDPKLFADLAAIEDNHFWFVPRGRLIAGLIERYFPRAERILEVGCGNGAVLAHLARTRPGRQLYGSELHPTALAFARKRLGPDVELVQMDARLIPAENAFDVIGAFDVIEHIQEDEEVLHSAFHALVPGGGMVIAVPQHPWLWSSADDMAHHVRRYRRGELEAKLERAKFEIVFSGSYCTALLPLMMMSRWKERLRPARDGSPSTSQTEFNLAPGLNAVLKRILNAEVGATLAGVRFPVGGSRIVVAVRP